MSTRGERSRHWDRPRLSDIAMTSAAAEGVSGVPRLANRISLDLHLDEQREREYEALEKEFSWLLENEYKQRMEIIDRSMEECQKKFSNVLNPSGGADLRPILLSSPQQGDSVFCMAVVNGDKISKAEITLKLPGRGHKPLKTFIKEHAAVKLKQIQDSANFFQQAQEKYHVIQQNRASLTTPEGIQRSFSDFCSSLRDAEEVLILPQLPKVQNLYTAEQRSHLQPELPEDLVLHFHISSVYLVLTVLSIAQTARRPLTTPQDQKTADETDSPWFGSTFEYGASTYEVVHQIEVKSQVPWLSGVLRLLQETRELTQDLIDKVTLFEAVGLPRK